MGSLRPSGGFLHNVTKLLSETAVISSIRSCAYVPSRTTIEGLERPWFLIRLNQNRGGLASCHDGNCSEKADGENATLYNC